jgi:pimeloyl-ACP methyl ester carboxylesterase
LKKEIQPYKVIRRTVVLLARSMAVLLIVTIILLLILDDFVEFRDTDDDLITFFQNKQIPAKLGYYNSTGRTIRYLSVGNENASSSILFLHGAPSSMSYFKPYLCNQALLQQSQLLSIDRPGYGYSGLGKPETSIELQVKMILPLLDSLRRVHHPLIVVAASYGTSVACRLAMDYPDLVDGLVLVAPSLAPGEERIYPISYLARNPLIKWMVPRMLISANAEKLSHQQELQKMLPLWKNIRVPVIYLQGKNDGLIYPANAEFARRNLVNASSLNITMIPGRGHLIAFLEIKRITRSILEMLQLSKKYFLAKKINDKSTITVQQAVPSFR